MVIPAEKNSGRDENVIFEKISDWKELPTNIHPKDDSRCTGKTIHDFNNIRTKDYIFYPPKGYCRPLEEWEFVKYKLLYG